MIQIKISRHYAKAIFNFALCTNELDLLYNEISQILTLINQNDNLYSVLINPLLSTEKKNRILRLLFKSFSKTTLNFLQLISLHKRTSLLKIIAKLFLNEYRLKKQWTKINIITSIPLSDELEGIIINKLFQKEKIQKKYLLSKEIDSSIIGGFIVRIGSKEWDMSISGKIRRLHKSLKGL